MKRKEINISLNMTNRCNLKCDYCIQTVRNNKNSIDMNIYDAINYLDNFVKENQDYEVIKIEFFGGEPTLKRHNIIKFLEEIITKEYYDKLEFSITTNAFIYFPEYFMFFHKHKINKFEMIISYDLNGQFKRTKNEVINNIIKNNIIKYRELCIELNFDIYKRIKIASCITESNVHMLYDYFINITYNLDIGSFNVTPVFPEYWKYNSFRILYKQIERIYDHIMETRNEKLKLFSIRFPFRDISSKHNTIQEDEDLLSFDKMEVFPLDKEKNYYYFHKDLRGSIKKTHKIKKEILDIIDLSYDYDFKSFEINFFKDYSCNKDIFNFITIYLISGANIKRYKNEIYELFQYNSFIMKKYIKLIKKIRELIEIDMYKSLSNNGILYFLSIELKKESFNKIKNILKNEKVILRINESSVNSNHIKIIYDDSIKTLGYNDKKNIIYINKKMHKDNKVNIQDTVLHEIFHLYLIYSGIDDILKEDKKQHLAELLCENFIEVFKNNIFNLK